MRITSVQNTNTSFGMSLRINPNVKTYLKKQPSDYLQNLKKISEDIKNIKSFDVVLDGNLSPKIKKVNSTNSKDYFEEFKEEESELGKYCSICFDDGSGSTTIGYFNPTFPNIFKILYKNHAQEKYNEFKKLDTIQQAAELSKMLDAQELKK